MLKKIIDYLNRKKYIYLLFIFFIFIALIIKNIGLHLDLDGYDEGVYIQTLRSLNGHHQLYTSIFYSQPPIFIQSIYPFYRIFGSSILAARIGISFFAILTLLATYKLASRMGGHPTGLIAALLLMLNLTFLKESTILQAEIPSLALTTMSLLLFYVWWRQEIFIYKISYSCLSIIFLVLAILTKLSSLVILPSLALVVIFSIIYSPKKELKTTLSSLLIGLFVGLIFSVIITLPYHDHLTALLDQVINYHFAAKNISLTNSKNILTLLSFIKQNYILVALMLIGGVLSIARRNIYLYPILVWLLFNTIFLLNQKPLFPHHLVLILPSMAIIAALTLDKSLANSLFKPLPYLSIFLIIILGLESLRSELKYNNNLTKKDHQEMVTNDQVKLDIKDNIKPNENIISDNQFLIDQSDRSTPPELVDTSIVRIESNYLSNQELIKIAKEPSTMAVLYSTNRLKNQKLNNFNIWVSHNYHLFKRYPNGTTLWLK